MAEALQFRVSGRKILKLSAAFWLFYLLSSSSNACIIDPLISVFEDPVKYLDGADFTFKGHVVAIDPAKAAADTYERVLQERHQLSERAISRRIEESVLLTFNVEKVWKGDLNEKLTAFFWVTGLECDVTPSVGNSFIVFGHRNETEANYPVILLHSWSLEKIESKLDAAIQQ